MSDLRHALRGLRQNRTFTITAVAALALGIGANTAIFTVVNTVILHPLPYPDSDRIINMGRSAGDAVSEPVFTFWQQNNPGFEDLAAYRTGGRMTLDGGDRPELVDTVTASRNYFRLFGAYPIAGRTFSASEDRPGGPRTMVLGYGLWQRRFGGDSGLLGKSVRLGGVPYTVIGILPPGFRSEPPADVWIPLQLDPNSMNQASILTVSARLPRGITLTQANAWIATLGKRLVETRPRVFYDPKTAVGWLQQNLAGKARPALLILLGAVGLVLLIACANVANLLLARGAGRQREIAIRAAVGAGRGRIVVQLLTEGLLLALAGGAFGLALGSWGVRALVAFVPGDLPRLSEMAAVPALDPLVAAFTFALAALTGILFGLAPAFQFSRTDLTVALKASGSRAGASRSQRRARAALVTTEVALAVVLLCGAVLLIRSFAALHSVNLGFESQQLLTMDISLSGPGYAKSSAVARVAQDFVDRAERIPGVASAAVASAAPLSGWMDMVFNIPGRAAPAGRKFTGDVQWRIVTPHYFDVLRIPLLSGRLFRERETRPTVVVNQAFARRFWPDTNPIGQTLVIAPELGPAYEVGATEVIGVVGDTRPRLDIEPQPFMYQMVSQIPDADTVLVAGYDPSAVLIRTRPGVAPMSVGPAMRQALAADGLAAGKVRTIQQLSSDSSAQRNFNVWLLALFAGIALALAAVGIYGVMAYTVEQRIPELALRIALGANSGDTLRLVLREALGMTIAGVAAGLAAAFGLTRLLAAQLFGVKPSDPLTFGAVSLILIAVALAAAYVPARRASRTDPLVALRHE